MEVENYAPDWSKAPPAKDSVQEALRELQKQSAHYAQVNPEPISVISSWLTDEQFIGFCMGNALKYIGRFNVKAKGKGGAKDIAKAIDYLEWLEERMLSE